MSRDRLTALSHQLPHQLNHQLNHLLNHQSASFLRLLAQSLNPAVVRLLVLSIALAGASGLLAGMAPVALKCTVDAALASAHESRRAASVALYAGAYLLCLGAGRALAEIRPSLTGAVEQQLYAALRLRYFRHVLQLTLAFHLEQRSGSLVHVLQQAITGCQIAMLSLVNGIVPILVEGGTVLAVLTSLRQPSLTAIVAATAAAYFVLVAARVGGLSDAARQVSETSAVATGILADGLTNVEPIKTFGAEAIAGAQYAQALKLAQARWQLLRAHRMHTGLATVVIFTGSMGGTLAIAVSGVHSGVLTIGSFVLINVYLVQMVKPLEMLATATRDLSQGLGFMAPFMNILGEPAETQPETRTCATGAETQDSGQASNMHASQKLPKPLKPRDPLQVRKPGPSPDPQHPSDLLDGVPTAAAVQPRTLQRSTPCVPSGPPHLALRDVHLAYVKDRPVLDALCLDIPAGKALAIVGASGSGKSSIVRLLLRLCTPQRGEIMLNGARLETLATATLRSMIAVVPQDTVLFNATIKVNIALGRTGATEAEIARAARLAGLHELIDRLPRGYDTPIGERGMKLSGGERQRIAIARAVVREPLIYVFDEATSMLDGQTEAAILKNLRQISAGRTTLMIAHRLSAVRHADEIAVLDGGKVVELGPHDALLEEDGLYAQMWRTQSTDCAR